MAARRRREKLDGVDAENIDRLLDTRGWQLIRQRIERTLLAKLSDLKLPKDAVDTATLRGYIAGLELALEVPQILMKEGKEHPTE